MPNISEKKIVEDFMVDLLSQSNDSAANLKEKLTANVEFKALGKRSTGRDEVCAALKNGPNSQLMHRMDWEQPVQIRNEWRMVGQRKEGSFDRGLIIILSFKEGAIAMVQQQKTPPPPPQALPLNISTELKTMINNALVEKHPILMAYCDLENQPVQTFRGSLQVFNDTQLAMWIRSPQGSFIQSIQKNPKVSFMYRNEDTKATYSIQGKARVSHDEKDRAIVYGQCALAEQDHDFAQIGVVVLVDLEKIEGYSGIGPDGQLNQIKLINQLKSAS